MSSEAGTIIPARMSNVDAHSAKLKSILPNPLGGQMAMALPNASGPKPDGRCMPVRRSLRAGIPALRRDRLMLASATAWKLGAQRLGIAALTLVIVSFGMFFATELLPGDLAEILDGQVAIAEAVANLRETMGLNEPALQRLLGWMAVALALWIAAAMWCGSWQDRRVSVAMIAVIFVAEFMVATLAVLVFAVVLFWAVVVQVADRIVALKAG
jgi:hypothetical protein